VQSRPYAISAWLASIIGLLVLVFVTHLRPLDLLSSHFIGGSQGDGGLYVWLAESFHYAPVTALFGESTAFYPYPLTRAWSDSFLLPSALVSILLSCGFSSASAYNTIYIGALVLNGLGVLALCRALALEWIPSFVAAASFASCSYLTGNFGHPQLQFFFWVPFAWACVIGSRDSRPLRWFAAGLCLAASFYCAVYYAIFAALGLGLILVLTMRLGKQELGLTIARALALGVGGLPIMWLLPSYLQVKNTFGSRGLYEADAFAASGLSYAAFSNFNRLFGFTSQWTHHEATLCAGITVLGISLAYIIRECHELSRVAAWFLLPATTTLLTASSIVDAGIASEILVAVSAWTVLLSVCTYAARKRSPGSILAVLVGVFFVLSFGPAGNPTKGEPALAPFTALYSLMPGMDSVRAVSRFGSVVIMGIYIAAACGLSAFFKGKPRRLSCSCILLLGVTLVENYTPVFPLDPLPPRPGAFDALRDAVQPNQAAIALPFAGELEGGRVKSWSESAILNTRYLLWSAPLGIPFVNGYSGQRPKLSTELPAALRTFPSSQAFEWLSRICGLRWIIVVPSLFPSWDQEAFERRLAEFKDRFALEAIATDGSLLIRIDPWTSTSAPIFAPASGRLLVEFQTPGSPGCTATVYGLARDKENNVTSYRAQQALLEPGRMSLELPASLTQTGQARLFTIDSSPCSSAFRCSPLDLGALK
jgi:hypothetical protein